jgi:D-xylose transport system substrate-binding protein
MMTLLRYAKAFLLLLVAMPLLLSTGCVCGPGANCQNAKQTGRAIRIGLSMDTLKEERWQHDRDLFLARAKELGAEVDVQAANGDDRTQIQQAANLLTQGVDVLVVVPHNSEVAASIVEAAKRQCVPVISYDRLIRNSDVDLYVSFDNIKVGELQAKYLVDRAPRGNYVLIGGSPTDNNAQLLRQGQMNILKPSIARGDIRVIADQWAKEWQASEALKHMENALTQAKNDVAAVVVSNDGTAGGVVQALSGQGLEGKVVVSGMDADLAALQRVVGGTQSMTIYKPIKPLATKVAEAAIALARGEQVATNGTVNNGMKDVPSVLLEPIVVDRSNMLETIIKDGFQKMEDIYRFIPRERWPKPPQSVSLINIEHGLRDLQRMLWSC